MLLLAACKPENEFRPPPPPQVSVQVPSRQDVTDYIEVAGQLAAVKSVPLVARVQGFLTEIDYRDGALVPKGLSLFTIEPGLYAAQRDQAEANLRSAEAKAVFGRSQQARYATLARTSAVSRMEAEQSTSDRQSADASVLQARAALEEAELTLSYTQVLAPFSGVVTAHQVPVGTLVGGNGPTELATIVQLAPIWVNFNFGESELQRLRHTGPPGDALRDQRVEIGIPGEDSFPYQGRIDYVAPLVAAETGTLAARALLPNDDHTLMPGAFARVRLGVHRLAQALVVPEVAIGSDQGGRSLLVVGQDNIVERRQVTLGPAADGGGRVVVSGISAEDRVIVNGLQRARPGQKVDPREEDR